MQRKGVLTEPRELVRLEFQARGIDIEEVKIPRRVYMLADSIYEEMISRNVGVEKYSLGGRLYVFKENEDIGFIKSAMCSPAIAIQFEDLAAGGVEEAIHVGFAGGISKDLKIGDKILTSGAYNDTAVAGLYGYQEEVIYSSESLTIEIKETLENRRIAFLIGLHWTTDAGYHETWDQVLHYRERGALCVEMEGVGLFTVARYRELRAAGIYIISDTLDHDGWTLGWSGKEINNSVSQIIDAIIPGK